MKYINEFYNELRRCDDANPLYRDVDWGYNGIDQTRGIEGYHQYICKLYNDALDELTSVSNDEKSICRIRLNEIDELQRYFDAPTQDVLDVMEREYISNNNKCLKDEIEHVKFVIGCVSLQKYYKEKFRKYLYINNNDVVNIREEPRQPQSHNSIDVQEDGIATPKRKSRITGDVIRGRKGVAEFTGLKLSSIQKLLNQGIIVPSPSVKGVCDRTLIFSKKQLEEDLFGNPVYEKMKRRSNTRCKRKEL